VPEALLSIIPFPEISAARAMPLLAAVPNQRDHYLALLNDRRGYVTRRFTMNLKRQYELHRPPPGSRSPRGPSTTTTRGPSRPAVRRGVHHRRRNHSGLHLPAGRGRDRLHERSSWRCPQAAANGDLLPTVFLSVQSDESRHNGFGTLLMALATSGTISCWA